MAERYSQLEQELEEADDYRRMWEEVNNDDIEAPSERLSSVHSTWHLPANTERHPQPRWRSDRFDHPSHHRRDSLIRRRSPPHLPQARHHEDWLDAASAHHVTENQAHRIYQNVSSREESELSSTLGEQDLHDEANGTSTGSEVEELETLARDYGDHDYDAMDVRNLLNDDEPAQPPRRNTRRSLRARTRSPPANAAGGTGHGEGGSADSSGFVDLTESSTSPPAALASHHRSRAPQPTHAGPSSSSSSTRPAKRRRMSAIENIDLTSDASATLLATQQHSTIMQQQQDSDSGPKKLSKQTCIICMDRYTNATTTSCGHMYCHECLSEALKASEKTGTGANAVVGNCPICRKPVRKGKASGIVPVNFMTRKGYEDGLGKGPRGGGR